MSTVADLERAVSDLPPEELARFRAWFLEFDAQVWDEQFESDVVAGRLETFADEALTDLRAGRTRPL